MSQLPQQNDGVPYLRFCFDRSADCLQALWGAVGYRFFMALRDASHFAHPVSVHPVVLFRASASCLAVITTMGFGCTIDPDKIYPLDSKDRQ
jgi:hypothetical protein